MIGQLIYRGGQIGIAYLIGSYVLGEAMALLNSVTETLHAATSLGL